MSKVLGNGFGGGSKQGFEDSAAVRLPPPVRAEYIREPVRPASPAGGAAASQTRDTSVRVPFVNRLFAQAWFRKCLIAALLALLWEGAARALDNDLLLPTFSATFVAFVKGIWSGELLVKSAISLSVLVRGYLIGVAAALVLTSVAVSTRVGRDVLSLLTAMLNPLPSIALLPIALLWFGLGTNSVLFVLVHSVLWPLALSTFAGFEAVPATLRMAGRNYGLKGIRQVAFILVPAALPAILSGLRVGWAFAWRTLIAAELVFGASSGSGGLGWYIFENRNELYTDKVFAGLATVIVIGLAVEHIVFETLERVTVRRWGMQH